MSITPHRGCIESGPFFCCARLPTANLLHLHLPTHPHFWPNLTVSPHFSICRLLHGWRGGAQQHHHRGRHAGQPGIQHCQGAPHGRAPRLPSQCSSARQAPAGL